MGLKLHRSLVVTQPQGHKEFSQSSFAERLTQSERSQLRGAANGAQDLKEELDRQDQIVGSRRIKQLMLDSGIFDQARIDELFS